MDEEVKTDAEVSQEPEVAAPVAEAAREKVSE